MKPMLHPVRLALLGLLLSLGTALGAPNILFIFIDDIGWGDMSCYGSPVQDKQGNPITPNMDRLASEGIRFTNGYVTSPICSPSRVGVLTGTEPARHAIYSFLDNRAHNASRNMNNWLQPDCVTTARMFHQAGYATGQFGKWHMGNGRDVNDAPVPGAYGFDRSLVAFEGNGDRLLYLNNNGTKDGLSSANEDASAGTYEYVYWYEAAGTDVDHALDFITEAVNADQPFYVHVPFNDTHSPYNVPPGQENDFDHISTNTNAKTFLGELHNLDAQIGRLVDGIDALGVGNNTLVVVIGDNGAPDDNINAILNRNGGLRGGKGNLFEGGIREPFFIRMPGTVPAGVVNSTTAVSTFDLLPTYCSLAGLPVPKSPLAGENMADVFTGATRPRSRPLFWEFGTVSNDSPASPKLAVRDGDFKLLRNPDGSNAQFYDLSVDRNETTNLINDAAHAGTIAAMSDLLETWYQEHVLGNFERPQTVVSEVNDEQSGGKSVRLYWDTRPGDWQVPLVSEDLQQWVEAGHDVQDTEITRGTLRWLDFPLPAGYDEKAFFRTTQPEIEIIPGTPVYFVSAAGEIRVFTGISGGELPTLGHSLGTGTLANTVPAYGGYQGFTEVPARGVYGVAGNGDVHHWASRQDWIDGATPEVAATGVYATGEFHGISYDGATGGIYAIIDAGGGDLAEYPTLADFLAGTNAFVTGANYGGNTLNFFYPGEDAPGNANTANAGSNYFQVSGGGDLEGWLTLPDYVTNAGAGGRQFAQGGFSGAVAAFAEIDAAPVYFVSSTGEIRGFTGIGAGDTPVSANNLAGGVLAGTVAAYGGYQGFTQVPGDGIYGVSSSGDVDRWPTFEAWLAGDAPTTVGAGSYHAGELHGISYDADTGGLYVIYEGSNSSRDDGDLGEYATIEDFIHDTNARVTPSTYGGNILNFYYPGEDAPGNANRANPGSNYFQVAGSGDLEGWLTLEDYTVLRTGAGGREFVKGGYGGAVAAFALMP
ncbi:sulfatase-like hydrolase/transferase [Haloferula sargassicola]|uniref:Sulfatase N-terminal domain-containing protein n=1 Tax=Haloferula sargassicola TaxID=490096 RepID=A0ABP9ULC1_9BACT